jgi:hypothetical protein
MLESFLFSSHLEDDEHAVSIVHKHWITGIKLLVFPSASLLLSLAAFTAVRTQPAFYVVALWAAASSIWLVREFLDYYMDAWIVTNQGVIDLEWHGWFHRQSSRILYSDVQGVSYEIKGVLGTLMRFGTLSVEKISTGTAISLADVPKPRSVEALILKNMETYLHTKNMKDARHVQEILAQIVTGHVQAEQFAPKSNVPAATGLPPKPAEPKPAPKRKAGFHSSKIGSHRSP